MKYIAGTTRKTKAYQAWVNMRRRCSPKDAKNWGARGICVHKEWDNFENFLFDMGNPPTDKHSIDRVDNNGDYCKENCRWASWEEQANNRRLPERVNLTGYRGVYLNRTGKAYVAMIKNKNIGSYKTKEEAALAYNKKAKELYGDKAILNNV